MHFVGVVRRGRGMVACSKEDGRAPHSAKEPSKDSYVIYFNFSQHVVHENGGGGQAEGGRGAGRRSGKEEGGQ